MPSGFQIVQSTLLKIDGFKLNIDNVESMNTIFIMVSIEFNQKINGYFNARNFSVF